jgi:type I pantothenate kinase
VATGKSTLATRLAAREDIDVAVVAADDFLWSNRELEADGLTARKGHPETYRLDELADTLTTLLAGDAVSVPVYSHVAYDVVEGERRSIEPADLVVVEGLHVLGAGPLRGLVDLGIFLDAPEAVAYEWYHQRLGRLVADARGGQASFYSWAVDLDPATVRTLLDGFWTELNLPLLRRHVAPSAAAADLLVHLDAQRAMSIDVR